MEKHLLLIHVGPVQEFIATARRSRDLWFGSWMLSELSKAAARAVVDQMGGTLIFPAPKDIKLLQPNSELNVANKIVANVEKPPPAKPEEDLIRKAIQTRLAVIWQEVLDKLERQIVAFNRQNARLQIEDLPEYYWVAVPYDIAQPASYTWARKQAESLLAARKTTRNFSQIGDWAGNEPKSSLDGTRESVIPERAYPSDGDSDKERQGKIDALYKNFKARPAERLSGVDILKRNGARGEETGFPSTSHMAALPLMLRLAQQKEMVRPIWQTYVGQLPDIAVKDERVPGSFADPVFGTFDGSLLFESRLGETLTGQELVDASHHLQEFLAKAADGAIPSPYYALLLADGDFMGEFIDTQDSHSKHQTLSQTLGEFAGQVQKIVEEHNGALVYAGGDDVLAFLPLHTVLNCAHTLAETFRRRMQTLLDESTRADQDKLSKTKLPTLSAGIAVYHHLEPLSDALQSARDAEGRAKSLKGKNALAVTVAPRGGAPRIVAGKWGEVDERLKLFIQLHRNEAIPDGAAYQLREAALRLNEEELEQILSKARQVGEIPPNDATNLRKALRLESIRILRRKQVESGLRSMAEADLNKLIRLILGRQLSSADLAESVRKEIAYDVAKLPDEDIRIEQLANELIIAAHFAKAYDQFNPITTQEVTL